MADNNKNTVMRKMEGERIMLRIPFNVVMTARITGQVEAKDLSVVLKKLRNRHALLGVRVIIDENDEAWYTGEDVPEIPIEAIDRVSEDQWQGVAIDQAKTSFEPEKGPLIRFTLLRSKEKSDLVICAHHVICDGVSLTYLIRDILEHLADPDREVDILPEPPVINRDTVPDPPSLNKIARKVMALMNKKWEKKNLRFANSDMKKLHRKFWEKNDHASVMAWESEERETAALIAKCKEEGVTVNTAIWTAFLLAQHDVQGKKEPHRKMAGMAVSTRDKLKIPAGEALGFFASSLTATLKVNNKTAFWDLARQFHKRIKAELAKTNPFGMITLESVNPSLIDSLYFSKYGLIKNSISEAIVKKMKWDKTNYGYSITNVGKVNIPKSYGNENYGPLKLEAVYGPFFYSDVNEKTVGVITVGNTMTYTLTYNGGNISIEDIGKIKKRFMHYMTAAIGTEAIKSKALG